MKKSKIIFLIIFNLTFLAFTPLLSNIQLNLNGTVSSINNSTAVPTSPDKSIFIHGTGSGPHDLDPVDSWDTASNDVIRQVCEPLFLYNLSNPNLPRLNWLCESYTWINDTCLEINIKSGVKFHDGTIMDAAACAWNFDRLMYLCNHTGQIPYHERVVKIHSLYEFPDGTPIFSHTEVIDSDTFQLHLNGYYGQILAAMSYVSCSILSPASTPATEIISLATGDIIGTGPYVYDYYTTDTEVRFHKWDEYWQEPANFDELVFEVIDDPAARNYAMLDLEIDYLSGAMTDLYPAFEASPYVSFNELAEPGLISYYLAMNNDITEDDGDPGIGLNITWRKAISYAINYSYIIHEMYDNMVARSYSFISPGYGPYFDPTLQNVAVPDDGNITHARKVIYDALSPYNSEVASRDIYNDEDWDLALGAPQLAQFNYSYNVDNWFRTDLYFLLQYWLGKIGIHVIDGGTDWGYFILRAYGYVPGGYDQLQLFFIGWGPDFPDPMNMMQPLISNVSRSNAAQVNDPWIETQIFRYNRDITLTENEKIGLIHNISKYLATEIYSHAFIQHNKIFTVHAADLYDVPYNPWGEFWAYPIKSSHYPEITSSGDVQFMEGETGYSITWNLNAKELSNPTYHVYRDDEMILDGSWGHDDSIVVNLDGLPAGEYVFKIIAYNGNRSLENYVNVEVYTQEHDLAVSLYIPSGIEVNNSYLITASVQNIGAYNESNVELLLYLDEVLIDSIIIPYLLVGASASIDYLWTPTEYKTYTFKADAPPVPGEVSQDDNMVIIDVSLTETQIFDGLFVDYIFDQMGAIYDTNFTYTYFQDTLFYETWNLGGIAEYQWIVDSSTRLMSNGSVFGDGTHTPVWIFTDVILGDVIPIAVNGEGDHLFNVVDEFIYDLPGFGPVGVWVLEDLNYSGGWAWYEQSTGILLNGWFYYYNGMYNYTLEFTDTNAQFMYLGVPGPFTLSSDAEDPDSDGIFTLSWTESDEADSYSVYQHSSFITEITGELIQLADGITDLSLPLEGYPDGTYYFIVVAHNEYGDTLSNCIQVNVELALPPAIMYDTIPDETMITYTRVSQIIGSVTAYSTSQIIYVGLIGEPDPGFVLDTTYTTGEDVGFYLSETTLMTTNQLEQGVHVLTLRIYNVKGMYYDKTFTVTVYRQAQLDLRGEFDYLLREKVRISVVAKSFDREDQFLLDPISIEGMTVHLKITDYNGIVKAEDTMTYVPDGYFHWTTTGTINQLRRIFTKGIYIVQVWIEFPPESYYLGGMDVIEFHIDPPAEDGIDPWFILGLVGFIGLVGVNITLAILLKRRHRIN